MKKSLVIFIIFLLVFSPTSAACWSRKEINQLAIVNAIGIDRIGEEFLITVQVNKPVRSAQIPGGGGKEKKAYEVMEARGKTIMEAVNNLSLSRVPFLAHANIIVLGKNYTQDGITSVLDSVSRTAKIQRTAYFLVADGMARDILEAEVGLADVPSLGIKDMIVRRNIGPKIVDTRVKDFLKDYLSPTTQPIVARIALRKDPKNREDWGVRQSSESIEPRKGEVVEKDVKSIKFNGAAVFRQDKAVGWLTPNEVKGLFWLKEEVEGATVVVASPIHREELLSFSTLRARSRLKALEEQGGPRILVNIKAEFNLMGDSSYSKITNENVTTFEEELARTVADEVRNTIRRAQELNSDIFGFGEVLHRTYPRQWGEIKERWTELFPDLPVEVQVRADIRGRGIIAQPPRKEQ